MSRSTLLLLCLGSISGGAFAAASADESAVTPIQKVLSLMKDMLDKGIEQKKAEATKFSAFSQWCTDLKRTKTDEIKAGEQEMEKLKAEILEADAGIRALSARIEELDEDVGRWTKDSKAATEVRDKESIDYKATLEDYSESIAALKEAIAVLKKQAYDRPQTELVQALIQLRQQRLVPSSAKAALAAYLQQGQPSVEAMPDDQLFIAAPEANAYEFQSGGVVQMLSGLLADFAGKKDALVKEELSRQHTYEQLVQQLTDSKENAQHEISKKTEARAATQKTKAEAEADLAQTTAERDEDQTYLDDTVALCNKKADDFGSRQNLRAEEIAALSKAIEIISSETVAGAGEKHLPSLLQLARRRVGVLAQTRSDQQGPLQGRVAAFLAERAKETGSKVLAEVVLRVAQNPFTKVKKLIKDLIVQLMEEATEETEHKGWCDTELTTNKQTRDRETAEANALSVEIDDLEAQIAQLTEDLATLATQIEDLTKAMAKATEDRTASKETNEQTIKDAKAAQVAVDQAMKVITDFYEKSAQATVFAQQTPAEDAPETFEKPYMGMLPEGGNIVDFLQVIFTDFARLESETSADEAAEQDEYEKFMFESKKSKALKENESKHKQDKRTDKESALHSAKEELKSTQEQLTAAIAYYEKLKPTCVDSGISYKERVARREAEIQSLQEALRILTGEEV